MPRAVAAGYIARALETVKAIMQPLRRSREHRPEPELVVSEERLHVFAGIILVLFGLLVARLWYLQVLQGDRFRGVADLNRSRLIRAAAPRGIIEDKEGRVLVTNRAQFTVFVVPPDLPKAARARAVVLQRLAGLLEITVPELDEAMTRNRAGKADPIPVAEGVPFRTLSRIAENRLRLPGVTYQAEPVRDYPDGKLAAHLLGAIGQINDRELSNAETVKQGYLPGDFIGKTGVEYQYDRFLNGRKGGVWYEVDARGRRQRTLRVDEPVAGATLRLCLDQDIQVAAERAMAGHHGAAVAIDPRNGRVLAMANAPTYNPNLFVKRPLSPVEYRKLLDPRNNFPLQNRAVSSPQPPGSTFKVITAAAGLASGHITTGTGDYCTGGISMGRSYKRCHSRHGSVDLESALAASCDVFFYNAGFRIGPTVLAQWSEQFGLGAPSGIDLPSEKGGTVPSPAWKRVMAPKFGNPDTTWYKGDTANMAIGQGDLQTTPLQMALVAAGIANNGVIYKPQVVNAVIGSNKKVLYRTYPKTLHKISLSPEHLQLVAEGMRSAVAGSRGTSRRASLGAIAVAGKSGSAETRGGGPTHAWFICYAPYDKPTIAVCVFLETNGASLHGGTDAAPVARAMMAAHFGLENRTYGSGGSRAD